MSKNDNKPTPEAPAVLPPQGAAASGPVEPVPRRLLDALVAAAQAVRANAHAPYSHFAVGAAVLDEQDRIHAGCNVENAAYPQGWCAEASALAVMVAAGGKRVHVVAVCAEGAEVVTPCGGCRQKLREFAADGCVVLAGDMTGLRASFTLAELLPHSFGPAHLRQP